MGRDLAQLHLGHDRQSEGRRLPPSRRGADGLCQHDPCRHGQAPRLSLDAADVPLQRLVLSVDAGRAGRHACLPALGARQGDVRRDRRPWRDASVRRADRHVDADQRQGRGQARVFADRHLQHRRRAAAGSRARRHGRCRLRGDPSLRTDRDLWSRRRQRMARRMGCARQAGAGGQEGAAGRALCRARRT